MASQGEIEAIVCNKFGSKCAEALLIARCESDLVPTRVNTNDARVTGHNSYGLFQINGPENWNWHDPTENTNVAYDKYVRRGWQPWTNCRNKIGLN